MSRQLGGSPGGGAWSRGRRAWPRPPPQRFVAEGADVFVVSVDADECAALGLPHAVADLSDEPSAVAGFGAAREALGRIDAVFAVAGGSGRRFGDGRLHEIPLAGVGRDDGAQRDARRSSPPARPCGRCSPSHPTTTASAARSC